MTATDLTFRDVCPDLASFLDEANHHAVDPAGIEAFTSQWLANVDKLAKQKGSDRAPLLFAEQGDFRALNACRDLLHAHGFSTGSLQRGAPTGVLFGDYMIAKWRNMSLRERQALHASISGDARNGPVAIIIHSACPPEVAARIVAAYAARQAHG